MFAACPTSKSFQWDQTFILRKTKAQSGKFNLPVAPAIPIANWIKKAPVITSKLDPPYKLLREKRKEEDCTS